MRALAWSCAALALAASLAGVGPGWAAPQAVPAAGPLRAQMATLPLTGIAPGSLADTPGVDTVVPLAGEDAPAPRSIGPRVQLRAAVATAPTNVAPFQLLGVTATAPFESDTRVLVRVRQGGQWQEWMQVPINDDGPDRSTAEGKNARYATIPVATGQSDGVQVRVDTPSGRVPADMKLAMMSNPQRAQDAALGMSGADASPRSGAAMPNIITRAEWGADESLRTGTTTYGDTIKVAFVHHVVSSNDYTPAEAAQEMRNIYSWFTQGIGCFDFGYNFMVDRYGRLYEGRAGGMDKAVIGAHTSGFNYDTFAVSFLGNSDTLNPTKPEGEKILNSIASLIAWKFSIFHVNPLGTAILTSAGPGPGHGTTSMYYEGEKVTINTIAGHGEIGSTACPGAFLRANVPGLRPRVAALMGGTFFIPRVLGSGIPWGSDRSISIVPKTTGPMDATLQVFTACGARVRTLHGSIASAGRLPIAWDGRDDAGKRVTPGTYTVTITGTADGKELFPWTGSVRIAPTADSPPDPCAPPDSFAVTGNGYGHGVGLSQWGALGMAKAGYDADQIVEHYYSGAAVKPYADDVNVRVSLLYQAEQAHARVEDLSASGSQLELTVGAHTVVTGGVDDNFTFTPNGRYVSVHKITGSKDVRVGRGQKIVLRWSGTTDPGTSGSTPSVVNISGPGESFASDGHRYRYGTVEISTVKTDAGNRLAVVNVLRLHDEYLLGIAEVVPSWPQDALQAQVIASRSYALATLADGKLRADCKCNMDDGDGPYYDQTFHGYQVESDPYGDNWRRAVLATATDATHGLTALYRDEPITAFYTAATGGKTNNASDVWGGADIPWASSVDDHWSLDAPGNPYNDWSKKITQDQMAGVFGVGNVMSVKVGDSFASGAAKNVVATVLGGDKVTISASKFRSALSLLSTYITGIDDGRGASGGSDPGSGGGTDPAPDGTVTLAVSPAGDLPEGTTATLTGRIKDYKGGLVVQRQVQWPGVDWQNRERKAPNADGTFSFAVTVSPKGVTYSWRIVLLDGSTVVAVSPTRTASVV